MGNATPIMATAKASVMVRTPPITAAAAQLVVAAVWLARRHPGLLRAPRSLPASLMEGPAGVPGRYRPEQGRSAQLWLALFLTYQSLTPILLYLRGGDESGKLGITLAVALAPLTLSLAWLHGRFPAFGALIASKSKALGTSPQLGPSAAENPHSP